MSGWNHGDAQVDRERPKASFKGSSTRSSLQLGSPPWALIWLDKWTFRIQGIVLTFHRSGNAGPATEPGFNPAKGLYSILERL